MKMSNPYDDLGEAFVSSVVAGNRGKIEGRQLGLSERLRQYAYYRQENATEAGDALLVNDLLDATRQLELAARMEREPQTSGETERDLHEQNLRGLLREARDYVEVADTDHSASLLNDINDTLALSRPHRGSAE